MLRALRSNWPAASAIGPKETMERRIVLARSTKGMTEAAANSGALPTDLYDLLLQIDGQSTSEELCARLDGLHRGQTAARISVLRQAGYITDHESTLVHRHTEPVRADATAGVKVAPPPVKSAGAPSGRSIERSAPRPQEPAPRAATVVSTEKRAAPPSQAGLEPRAKPAGLNAIVTLDDAAIVQRTDKGFRATAGLERGLSSEAISFLTRIATPISIGELCKQTGYARTSLVAGVLDLAGDGYLEVSDAPGTRSQGSPVKAPMSPPAARRSVEPARVATPRHSHTDHSVERRAPPVPAPRAEKSVEPNFPSLGAADGRIDHEISDEALERDETADRRHDDRRKALGRAETAAKQRRAERANDTFANEATDHVLGDIEATQRTINQAAARHQTATRESPKPVARRARGPWVRNTLIGLGVISIVVGTGGYVVLHTLDVRRIEAIATSHLGEAVRISDMGFAVWPRPALVLRDVTVGAEGRFRAPTIRVAPNRALFFGSGTKYSRIDIQGGVVAADFFWKHAGESVKPAVPLSSSRIEFDDMTIVDPKWRFTRLSASMTIKPSGQIQSMRIEDENGATALILSPNGPQSAAVELTARSFQPKGSGISLASLTGNGTLTPQEFIIREFQAHASGTTVRGTGRLRIGQRWTLDGTLDAKAIDLAAAAPALFRNGTAIGQARYSTSGASLDALFGELSISGTAALDQGVITGVDFVRALQESSATGGSSAYNNGQASFQWSGNRLVISSFRVGKHGVTAEGGASVDAEGRLAGRLAATSTMQEDPITGSFGLSGTLAKPLIRRVY
jgi:hypothetical protein